MKGTWLWANGKFWSWAPGACTVSRMLPDIIGGERLSFYSYETKYGSGACSGKIPKSRRHDTFTWYEFENSDAGPYFAPNYVSYSDYSGGTVEQSNYRVFIEQFADLEFREWWRRGGGHGSMGIVLRVNADERHEGIREFFEGLVDYPLADEEDHSNLEMEREEEDWNSYGASNFERAVKYGAPEELEDRVEHAFDGNWYWLWRAMSEITNDNVSFEEGGGAVWPFEESVNRTLAKATDDEWVTLLELAEQNNDGDYEYRGRIYKFLKALRDTRIEQNELVKRAWKRFGLAQFKKELREAFITTWSDTTTRYIPNPVFHEGVPGAGVTSPARMIRAPGLTEGQKREIELDYKRLMEASPHALTLLFFELLAPIWDERNPATYQSSIHMRDRGIDFNFHWSTRYFARWAVYEDFAILLDALEEGDVQSVAHFKPALAEFFAQQT